MQLTQTYFQAPFWLRNRHVQTIIPSTPLCRVGQPSYQRERMDLPDGDFLDLDWYCDETIESESILIVLHGLEGSSNSSYARMVCTAARSVGIDSVVMNFRGCSGESNRLPRRYHAGETGDFAQVLKLVQERYPQQNKLAVGYSLGGNVLLKYLGQNGTSSQLTAAAAICPPFDLAASAVALERPQARFYQLFLLRNIRRAMMKKYDPEHAPFDWQRALDARNFFEFDDTVTAPLHGFKGAEDYYAYASCGQYLAGISTPTLLLGALDDPFMLVESFPEQRALPDCVSAQFSEHGGHVGFVHGTSPLTLRYWLPERIMGYFAEELGFGQNLTTAQTATA